MPYPEKKERGEKKQRIVSKIRRFTDLTASEKKRDAALQEGERCHKERRTKGFRG